jgi:hypothetical protein
MMAGSLQGKPSGAEAVNGSKRGVDGKKKSAIMGGSLGRKRRIAKRERR